jgi:hypothetical protein
MNPNSPQLNINPPGFNHFFTGMKYHNTNGSIFFLGANDIFKTDDGGNIFVNTGAAGNWSMTTCTSDDTKLYAAGGSSTFSQNGEFYRSTNSGDSWTMMTNPAPNIKLTDISVNPTNADQVWVSVAGFNEGKKVYYSINGGLSWTDKSGSIPNIPVNCLTVDGGNNVYLGTDIGVYYLGASSSDWTPFYNGLPNVPVTDLVLHSGDQKIRAATYGRGVWEADVYSPCSSSLYLLSLNIKGDKYYQTSDLIQVAIPIEGGANTHVTLKAGDNITFFPGFEAKTGNYVHGFIGPCNSGIP